jgi:hypothetical protein
MGGSNLSIMVPINVIILHDTYLHFPIILSFMYLFFVKKLYINYGNETPNVITKKKKKIREGAKIMLPIIYTHRLV